MSRRYDWFVDPRDYEPTIRMRESGRLVATCASPDVARQIVDDHDAQHELEELKDKIRGLA